MKEFGWSFNEYQNTPGIVIDAMATIIGTRQREEEKAMQKAEKEGKRAKYGRRH